jgi:hypothetical protein
MVKRLLPLILIPLAGCAFAPQTLPPAAPVTVMVPVLQPVYCAAPAPQYPSLPIGRLTAASPPADTIRAYAASVIILKGVVRERDGVIAGCADPSSEESAGKTAQRADQPGKGPGNTQ